MKDSIGIVVAFVVVFVTLALTFGISAWIFETVMNSDLPLFWKYMILK